MPQGLPLTPIHMAIILMSLNVEVAAASKPVPGIQVESGEEAAGAENEVAATAAVMSVAASGAHCSLQCT